MGEDSDSEDSWRSAVVAAPSGPGRKGQDASVSSLSDVEDLSTSSSPSTFAGSSALAMDARRSSAFEREPPASVADGLVEGPSEAEVAVQPPALLAAELAEAQLSPGSEGVTVQPPASLAAGKAQLPGTDQLAPSSEEAAVQPLPSLAAEMAETSGAEQLTPGSEEAAVQSPAPAAELADELQAEQLIASVCSHPSWMRRVAQPPDYSAAEPAEELGAEHPTPGSEETAVQPPASHAAEPLEEQMIEQVAQGSAEATVQPQASTAEFARKLASLAADDIAKRLKTEQLAPSSEQAAVQPPASPAAEPSEDLRVERPAPSCEEVAVQPPASLAAEHAEERGAEQPAASVEEVAVWPDLARDLAIKPPPCSKDAPVQHITEAWRPWSARSSTRRPVPRAWTTHIGASAESTARVAAALAVQPPASLSANMPEELGAEQFAPGSGAAAPLAAEMAGELGTEQPAPGSAESVVQPPASFAEEQGAEQLAPDIEEATVPTTAAIAKAARVLEGARGEVATELAMRNLADEKPQHFFIGDLDPKAVAQAESVADAHDAMADPAPLAAKITEEPGAEQLAPGSDETAVQPPAQFALGSEEVVTQPPAPPAAELTEELRIEQLGQEAAGRPPAPTIPRWLGWRAAASSEVAGQPPASRVADPAAGPSVPISEEAAVQPPVHIVKGIVFHSWAARVCAIRCGVYCLRDVAAADSADLASEAFRRWCQQTRLSRGLPERRGRLEQASRAGSLGPGDQQIRRRWGPPVQMRPRSATRWPRPRIDNATLDMLGSPSLSEPS